MRTTIDIDAPILADLRKLCRAYGKPMGRLVSDLLAAALRNEQKRRTAKHTFTWVEKPMGARLDIADRDAVYAAMDREQTE
jgi:hypothetical protein